ncbi:tellurite resistance TerB family protein [Paraglaciecola aquimarina]|uniref:Tellurite resistance TerB family protein n=1 Tax=Paraglaciecola algarum TaxID=3050085 RepID=A0ABS9D2T8_9ALTE|nr:tellurite resistance TerB family protein [Paraglaciecola sp. G1-23]MCF2947050.1 tellurite resistance TerB family protein [Paraglaciecola sp. G1-23]
MNFQNLLNQFTGSDTQINKTQHSGNKHNALSSGLLGGAAAGGIMGLLAGNKSARKFAGKAAMVGGTALIGGIAFKAYRNWQRNNNLQVSASSNSQNDKSFEESTINQQLMSDEFQLTLIKAMIAAAKSDGHIDANEQQRIFSAVENMNLNQQVKGLVFDLLRQPIYIQELAMSTHNLEQKTEVYLASCLAIDADTDAENLHLEELAKALKLPADLEHQIKIQAGYALNNQQVSVS